MNFDMPYSSPQFTNPWASTSSPAQTHSLYASSHNLPHNISLNQHNHNLGLDLKQPQRLSSNVPMGSYASMPITGATAGSPLLPEVYEVQDFNNMSQDLLSSNRSMAPGYPSEPAYSSAPSPVHNTYAPSPSPYEAMGYAPAPVRSTYAIQSHHQDNARRLSQPSVPSSSFLGLSEPSHHHRQNSLIDFNDRGMQADNSRSFGDAIDASRGMIAMSQTTPRNIYGSQGRVNRNSSDSYGFPTAHSSSSSISSTSNYPSYFGGSIDSSVSDYAGSDMESVSSRTLPRPSGIVGGGIPPAPQSMMGQFSSKVSSNTQKKHKCKVCDKRFTRPSSLQTHMYSHTGEKRKSYISASRPTS